MLHLLENVFAKHPNKFEVILVENGADRAYPETFETALLMGEDILELVGASPLDAQSMAEVFRDASESAELSEKLATRSTTSLANK